jgi:hypothetical protein
VKRILDIMNVCFCACYSTLCINDKH